jgi:phage shock protein PspC (stress-responsive transcriptional regulator)
VHRLYRHPTDKVIGGVAAGLGVWMNVDPTIVRIVWVLLAIFTGGVFLVIYIVMLFVVPLPPQGWVPGPDPGGQPPAGVPPQGGWTAWQSPAAPAAGSGTGPPPDPGAASGGWQQQAPAPGTGWTPPAIGNGNAGIVGGVILILLGAWFLVDQYVDIDWTLLWPVLVMLAGVALVVLAARRGGRVR